MTRAAQITTYLVGFHDQCPALSGVASANFNSRAQRLQLQVALAQSLKARVLRGKGGLSPESD